MPIVKKTARLSKEDLAWLNKQIREHAYGDIEEVTALAVERGLDIGKSAVGVHSKELKWRDQAVQELEGPDSPDLQLARLRMEALAISARIGGEMEELIWQAEEILRWALTGTLPTGPLR